MHQISPQFVRKCVENQLQDQTCEMLHNHSCNYKAIVQFLNGAKGVYKMYLLVHILPLIIFKQKKIKSEPLKELKKFIFGLIRSLIYAGGHSAICSRVLCLLINHYKFRGSMFSVGCVIGGLALLFETQGRQAEIALYGLNKSLQAAYSMAIRRKIPIRIKNGQCLVIGVALAMICHNYINHRECIREKYINILDYILKQY